MTKNKNVWYKNKTAWIVAVLFLVWAVYSLSFISTDESKRAFDDGENMSKISKSLLVFLETFIKGFDFEYVAEKFKKYAPNEDVDIGIKDSRKFLLNILSDIHGKSAFFDKVMNLPSIINARIFISYGHSDTDEGFKFYQEQMKCGDVPIGYGGDYNSTCVQRFGYDPNTGEYIPSERECFNYEEEIKCRNKIESEATTWIEGRISEYKYITYTLFSILGFLIGLFIIDKYFIQKKKIW